ncbi:MAG: ribose-5-phosphate isomerase RpiA [Deltaproteobacteria bacterium]|nr:ribose-5-phosphate isomerase RpiA [Deltaproteobacteria bacterium]
MSTPDYDRERRLAAEAGVALVEPGMVVGLGTGSAASHAVRLLGARVRAGLAIRGVPTSTTTRALAGAEGIPLVGIDEVEAIDLTLDGTDEFDPRLNLIKGGGGALLFEKLVATASKQLVILCESRKEVHELGAFPLPIEVVPVGWRSTARRLEALEGRPELRRTQTGSPFVTDGGHYILDVPFGPIRDPGRLADRIDGIVGVVEHGLFVDLAERVLMGRGDRLETFVAHR